MRESKQRRERVKLIKAVNARIVSIEQKLIANKSEFIRAHYRAALADALRERGELERKQ